LKYLLDFIQLPEFFCYVNHPFLFAKCIGLVNPITCGAYSCIYRNDFRAIKRLPKLPCVYVFWLWYAITSKSISINYLG